MSGEPNKSNSNFPIIALGSSAGGLEAMKEFFQALPENPGMAFIITQHFSPKQTTLLDKILNRHTSLDISLITDKSEIKENHIFIAPSDMKVTFSNGGFSCSKTKEHDILESINTLFGSISETYRERVIGIILSGSGQDGAQGLHSIKLNGGMVIAQLPETAQNQEMPNAALRTGLMDFILPPDEMASKIVKFANSSTSAKSKFDSLPDSTDISEIIKLLHEATSHDFQHYKKNTFLRRISRRMKLKQTSSFQKYVDFLTKTPEELLELFNDILIGVTMFFREPDSWNVLNDKVIKKLISDTPKNGTIRTWVPACATGEEAYSLAILMNENIKLSGKNLSYQIFATDIDTISLATARAGCYPAAIIDCVSSDYLEKYFHRNGNRYCVNSDIRDSIIFSQQNLVTDPPFSKLDLVSCRNLLIYLDASIQQNIINLFHFSLNKGGYLTLGNSESLGHSADLFSTVSSKWRIFRKTSSATLPAGARNFGSSRKGGYRIPPFATPNQPSAKDTFDNVDELLLSKYVPPSFLVNNNHEILYHYGETSKFLRQPSGQPTTDLFSSLHKPLATIARQAFHKAKTDRKTTRIENTPFQLDDQNYNLTIQVSLVNRENPEDGYLATFFENALPSSNTDDIQTLRTSNDTLVSQLEAELFNTKEALQLAIEELETSNEELKSSNEEAMSMNEELQSANEELETSKEELQSMNEELAAINSQLEGKVVDVLETNIDLKNLMSSTKVATIFLDLDNNIRRFTPETTNLMALIETDIGRSIEDITRKFTDDALLADIKKVLNESKPIRDSIIAGNKHYSRRILPYVDKDGKIDGTVITFTDITELTIALQQTKAEKEKFQNVFDTSPIAFILWDTEQRVTAWNHQAEKIFGWTHGEIIGKKFFDYIIPDSQREYLSNVASNILNGEIVTDVTNDNLTKSGNLIKCLWNNSVIYDHNNNIIGGISLASDVSEKQRFEDALKESENSYRTLTHNLTSIVYRTSLKDSQTEFFNAKLEDLTGYTQDEITFESNCLLSEIMVEEDKIDVIAAIGRNSQTKKPFELNYRIFHKDGTTKHLHEIVQPIFGGGTSPVVHEGVIFDTTARKMAEKQLNKSITQLEASNDELQRFTYTVSHDLKSPLITINGFLGLLETELDEKGKAVAKPHLKHVYNATSKMENLLRDLLELSRVGRMANPSEKINIEELANDALELTGIQISNPKIKVSISNSLPTYACDRTRMLQVMQNLLENAIKYMGTPEKPKIEIGSYETDGQQICYVKDNGIGIESKYHTRIFGLFDQLSAKSHGTGVGLSLVKRIIEVHGGRIWVESEGTGKGSRFCFTMPK